MMSKVKSWDVECIECSATSEDSVLQLFKKVMLMLQEQNAKTRTLALQGGVDQKDRNGKCAIL